MLANVPLATTVTHEAPFGSLALLIRFSTLDEATAEANRAPFGLAGHCFTEYGCRQAQLDDAIEAGMVCMKTVRTSWPDAPFGGMTESGVGSVNGSEGTAAHMITTAVHVS